MDSNTSFVLGRLVAGKKTANQTYNDESPIIGDKIFQDTITVVDDVQMELTNGTDELPIPNDLYLDISAVCVPILFGIFFLVGILGNGTLIFTVIKNKSMRNAPNFYIVSLAAGDILLIVIAVPFNATYYTLPDWPFGMAMCKLVAYLKTFSLGVSVFTLMALSADRYSAIVNPMVKHAENPVRRTLFINIFIWIVSAALAIPDAVTYHVVTHPGGVGGSDMSFCNPFPASTWYPKFNTMFKFVIYFAIPVVVIGLFYACMAKVLIASSEHFPGSCSYTGVVNLKRQMQARRKVARIVLFFVVIFIICWLPHHVYMIRYHFSDDTDVIYSIFWSMFKIVAFCLSFMNSCVNPMSLYFLSKQFRGFFHSYLFCCCCHNEEPQKRSVPADNITYNTVRRSSTTMTIVRSTSHNSQGHNNHYNVTTM